MQRAPKAICFNRQEGADSTDLVRPQTEIRGKITVQLNMQHLCSIFGLTLTHAGLREWHCSHSSECVNRKLDDPVCPPSGEENVSVANMLQRLLQEHEGSPPPRCAPVSRFPSCQVMQTSIKFVLIKKRQECVAPERGPGEVSGSGARGFLPSDRPLGAAGRNITDSACTCQLVFAATGAAHFIPERTRPAR